VPTHNRTSAIKLHFWSGLLNSEFFAQKTMKRLHLFEIHDQEWCPGAIRDAETDYLQFVIAKMKGYAPVVPVLATALQRTATRQVFDLCSGAGGPWFWLQPVLAERGLGVSVCLTDKYPNLARRASDRPVSSSSRQDDPEPVPLPARLAQ